MTTHTWITPFCTSSTLIIQANWFRLTGFVFTPCHARFLESESLVACEAIFFRPTNSIKVLRGIYIQFNCLKFNDPSHSMIHGRTHWDTRCLHSALLPNVFTGHSRPIQEAQLPQRNRTTRYVSKFVLFHENMGNRKVSNNKNDVEGHSRALAMVPFDRSHTISY